MQKKLMILAIVILSIGLFLYSNVSSDVTNKDINMQWTLSDSSISEMGLEGALQDINVEMTRTDAEESVVRLTGKVSSKSEKFLKNTQSDINMLKIALSDPNGLAIMPSNGDKDTLTLNIELGRDADIKKLNIRSVVGDVNVKVLEEYQGQYVTDVSSGGEVMQVPDTDNSQDSTLYIKTIGDINISK